MCRITLDGIAALNVPTAPITCRYPSFGFGCAAHMRPLQRTVDATQIIPIRCLYANDFGTRTTMCFAPFPPREVFHRTIEGTDTPATIEDHDAVDAMFNNSSKVLLFSDQGLKESCIGHGNGCLICKSAQYVLVIAAERHIDRRSKHQNIPDICIEVMQRQGGDMSDRNI